MTDAEEVQRLHKSVHDLRNDVTKLSTEAVVRELKLAQIKVDVDRCVAQSATSTQLQNAVEVFTLKLDTFGENLKTLNRIVTWVAAMVGAAVLGAVLTSVLK